MRMSGLIFANWLVNTEATQITKRWQRHRWMRPNPFPLQLCWSSTRWFRAAWGSGGGSAETAACKVQYTNSGSEGGRGYWMKMFFPLQQQHKGQNTTDPCRPGDAVEATQSWRVREGQGNIVLALHSQALNTGEQSVPSKNCCFINDAEKDECSRLGRSCASTGVYLSALNY